MSKNYWNLLLMTVAIAGIVLSIIDIQWFNCHLIEYISLTSLIILAIINMPWRLIVKYLCNWGRVKENCPYYFKDDCPYGSKEDCVYNSKNCRAHGKTKRRKIHFLWPMIIICLVAAFFIEIKFNNKDLDISKDNYLNFLFPILCSIAATGIVAALIDIPGRMKEYQSYFIDLFSSSDYLKKMSEEQLTSLRKEVTWLLHIKDYPNMPKKLIDMDERFCKMLKMPYYKEYSQTVNVKQEDGSSLRKKIDIEFTAYNPHHKDNPVKMDVSFSNSLCFTDGANKVTAQKLFSLNKITCSIDNFDSEVNLKPYIKIGVSQEARDGFSYNGRIALMSKEDKTGTFNSPLSITNESKKEGGEEVLFDEDPECSNAKLYLSFRDKIKVKIQYEIVVPKDDTCFTKRLRYPAKYFHLDYQVGEDVNFNVVGQLIGTLMDQPDVSIDVSENKKRIKMNTHNWLLPKNGAVVVHY